MGRLEEIDRELNQIDAELEQLEEAKFLSILDTGMTWRQRRAREAILGSRRDKLLSEKAKLETSNQASEGGEKTEGRAEKVKEKMSAHELYIEAIKKLKTSEPSFKDLEDVTGISPSTWQRRFSDLPWLVGLQKELHKRQSYKFSKKPAAKQLMEYAEAYILEKIDPKRFKEWKKDRDKPPNEDVTTNKSQSDPYADLDDAIDEEQRRGDRTAMGEE